MHASMSEYLLPYIGYGYIFTASIQYDCMHGCIACTDRMHGHTLRGRSQPHCSMRSSSSSSLWNVVTWLSKSMLCTYIYVYVYIHKCIHKNDAIEHNSMQCIHACGILQCHAVSCIGQLILMYIYSNTTCEQANASSMSLCARFIITNLLNQASELFTHVVLGNGGHR